MALVEQYANSASSTLNGSILSGDASLTLVDGSAFPSAGNFRLIIDAEILIATARSGNTLTVTRGQEGTTAAGHSSGATVTHILTAGAVPEIFRRHSFYSRTNKLDDADYTQVNFSSTTVTTKNNTINVRGTANASANLRVLVKSLPSAPYKITVPLWFNGAGNSAACGGIVLRESSSGKMVGIGLRGSDGIEAQKWTNATTFSALYTLSISLSTWRRYGKPIYLQFEDNNTNRSLRIGEDPISLEDIITAVLRTDFITPDQYGFYMNVEGTGDDRILTVYDVIIE